MQSYLVVKMVKVKPMTRKEYNDFRGWDIPDDEDGGDDGFLVESLGDAKANTDHYEGYVSWSPLEVLENSYRKTDGMTFGLAIEAAKMGKKIQRKGWDGKGMWVIYNPGSKGQTHAMFEGSVYKSHGVDECEILPHFDMKTASGAMLPGWLASQSDMDAEDWTIFDGLI